MKVNIRSWASRNMWTLPGGEFATRPGMRWIYGSPSGSSQLMAAWTIPVHGTWEHFHYIITQSESGSDELLLRVFDEDFRGIQILALGTSKIPRDVSFGTVLDQVVVSSPDFPTLWGINGGPLVVAGKKTSDNEAYTPAIPVPRGIGAAWNGRWVIVDGTNVYISDPVDVLGGSPRTFTGVNQQWRPGICYGVHVGLGGDLILATTTGVYAFPRDAAAAGQEAVGAWQQLSTHRTVSFRSTAMFNGRLYGLTRRGFRLIDVEGGEEYALDDPLMPMCVPRIARNDWREAQMFEGQHGPIISSPEHEHFLMTDVDRGVRSWWQRVAGSSDGLPVGTCLRQNGEELIALRGGLARVLGNFDDTAQDLTEIAMTGRIYGTIPVTPEESAHVRAVSVASDATDEYINMSVAHRGQALYSEASEEVVGSPKISYDSWDDAGLLYDTPRLRAHTFDFGDGETRDPTIEITVPYPAQRVSPIINVTIDGIAAKRPT